MSASLHEVVWATGLLEYCPDVQVLSLRVDTDVAFIAHEAVPMTVLGLHVAGIDGAAGLAVALGLREDPTGRLTPDTGRGPLNWRTWRGWAAEGSRESAVWVELTASEYVEVVVDESDGGVYPVVGRDVGAVA